MKTATKIEIVVSTIVVVMIIGTLAYHSMEGWGYIDSFYFTGTTMTTVGSDIHPTTPISKIFTVFFAFGGVGISLFALSLFAAEYFERREKRIDDTLHRKLINSLKSSINDKDRKKRVKDLIDGSKDLNQED